MRRDSFPLSYETVATCFDPGSTVTERGRTLTRRPRRTGIVSPTHLPHGEATRRRGAVFGRMRPLVCWSARLRSGCSPPHRSRPRIWSRSPLTERQHRLHQRTPNTCAGDIAEREWSPPPRPTDCPSFGLRPGHLDGSTRAGGVRVRRRHHAARRAGLGYGQTQRAGGSPARATRPGCVAPTPTGTVSAVPTELQHLPRPRRSFSSPLARPGICARQPAWTIVVHRTATISPWHADVAQLVARITLPR